MIESAQFLESLEHDNLDRPRFTIKPGLYENLEIGFRGQVNPERDSVVTAQSEAELEQPLAA